MKIQELTPTNQDTVIKLTDNNIKFTEGNKLFSFDQIFDYSNTNE